MENIHPFFREIHMERAGVGIELPSRKIRLSGVETLLDKLVSKQYGTARLALEIDEGL